MLKYPIQGKSVGCEILIFIYKSLFNQTKKAKVVAVKFLVRIFKTSHAFLSFFRQAIKGIQMVIDNVFWKFSLLIVLLGIFMNLFLEYNEYHLWVFTFKYYADTDLRFNIKNLLQKCTF